MIKQKVVKKNTITNNKITMITGDFATLCLDLTIYLDSKHRDMLLEATSM